MDFLGKMRPVHAANTEGDDRGSTPEALLPVQNFLAQELRDAEKDLALLSAPESPAEKAQIEMLMQEAEFDWDPDIHRELLVNGISVLGAKIKMLNEAHREFSSGNYVPASNYLDAEIKNIEKNVQNVQEMLGSSRRAKRDLDRLKQVREILERFSSKEP
ncbi:hypothetical protein HY413_02200 [Candidatus Kaiserbacteria bacterium]|nr:hypothetical protein [Candidatus Kaiserbacteria bacterium]